MNTFEHQLAQAARQHKHTVNDASVCLPIRVTAASRRHG